jgi:glycosyltransferase involved in cell wall biosynthesis
MGMSKGNLISIILPCYNVDPELFSKSLESVLNQTYDNLELIVTIDPFNEETTNHVKTTLDDHKDDGRITTISHKKRKGLVYSLNEGILKSRGAYIARIDSDDVCHKTRIEKQQTLMKKDKIQLTGTWAFLYDRNNVMELRKPVEHNTIRRSIMMYNPFIHSTVMVKKTVLADVGLYDSRFPYSEDYELWMRILSKGYRTKNIPEFLVTQNMNTESVTRKHWIKNRLNFIKCKYYGYTKHNFNSLNDLVGLLSSPLALAISPNLETHLKHLTNRLV